MTLDLLIHAVIYIFFFLFPVFYLPLTSEAYEYNKMALFTVIALVLFILICIKIVRKRQLVVVKSTFGLPLVLLAGTYLLSTFSQSPNKVIALTTPLSTTTIVAGTLFYLLFINILHNENENINEGDGGKISEKNLMTVLTLDAIIISLYCLLLTTGILPQIHFTPAGSLLATVMFLSTIAVYEFSSLLKQVFLSLKRHRALKLDLSLIPSTSGRAIRHILSFETSFHLLSSIFITITAILLVIKLATDQKPIFLPFSFGWTIFAEILKSSKTFFLGIGPSNFITAFTLAKPETINNTPFWNMIFTSSSSFLLNLTTEAGIVAAVLFILIFLKSLKLLKRLTTDNRQPTTDLPLVLSLIFVLSIQCLLPGSMTLIILTFILLAFLSEKITVSKIDLTQAGKLIYLPFILLILSSSFIFYLMGRIYLSEIYFKSSLDKIVNNQIDKAYLLTQKAIGLNPYIDRYHLAFSKNSLMIANSLSAKENLSDQDKQNVPMLVRQTIDQAKIAIILYQTNVVNWDNLASIYASLINFVAGSEEFAIKSYQQKITLDRANPNNYLALGGLYLRLKRYKEAEDNFREAINLKPDLANAYYNLSISLREQKKYKEAYQNLQITLTLLPAGSENAKKIEAEIKEVEELSSD